MWRKKKGNEARLAKETPLVRCSMKERGCDWSGPLDQLNAHLDPSKSNCQFVDARCPLHCHAVIPKKKVEQHVSEECSMRPYVCQHCNFKATYKEIVEDHLQKCLTSLHRRKESCTKKDCVEDVEQKFSELHCKGDTREDVSQGYCFLTPSTPNVKVKIQELERRLHEYELKFQQQEEEHRQNQHQLMLLLKEQDVRLQAYDHLLKEFQKEQEKLASELQDKDSAIKCLQQFTTYTRTYVVQNFSEVKQNGWRSRSSYLRLGGCKFGVIIDYTGHGQIRFSIVIKRGVFDQELRWPCCVSFTLELLNQRGGSNLSEVFMGNVQQDLFYKVTCLQSADIGDYLRHDSLHFTITK